MFRVREERLKERQMTHSLERVSGLRQPAMATILKVIHGAPAFDDSHIRSRNAQASCAVSHDGPVPPYGGAGDFLPLVQRLVGAAWLR